MTLLFFIGEFKEPFLFKGYASRLFWFLFGASLASRIKVLKNSCENELAAKHRSES